MPAGTAKVVVTPTGLAKVTIDKSPVVLARSGTVDLASAALTKTITFNTPLGNANYVPIISFRNATDNVAIISFPHYIVTSILTTGFTIEFSSAIITANYKMLWAIAGHNDP